RLSRIRVSSVTRILRPRVSVGTLKSTRTNTRFPRTSRSRSESFAISQLKPITIRSRSMRQEPLLRQHFHQFHTSIAVAPFVVLPTDYFHKSIAEHYLHLA